MLGIEKEKASKLTLSHDPDICKDILAKCGWIVSCKIWLDFSVAE